MSILHRDLNLTDKNKVNHIKALKETFKEDFHYEIYKFLYGNLDIVDSKASSLLTYNSLVIAGIAILLSLNNNQSIITIVCYSIILLFLISSVLCMTVVYLHWSSTDDLKDTIEHLKELIDVREKRTVKYRLAWILSFSGTILFLITLLCRILIKIFKGI